MFEVLGMPKRLGDVFLCLKCLACQNDWEMFFSCSFWHGFGRCESVVSCACQLDFGRARLFQHKKIVK